MFKILLFALFCQIYCRMLIARLCFKDGLEMPQVFVGRTADKNSLGKQRGNKVFIYIENKTFVEIKNTIYHEYRHIWQQKKYRELYDWCSKKPEYKSNDDFYYYCPIEVDARRYAKFNGILGDTSILDYHSVDYLENIYQKEVSVDSLILEWAARTQW